MPLYWNTNANSLDDYRLAEKRFDEIKTVYIDAFETLCRISVIAATLEGVIQYGTAVVPKTNGYITTEAFQVMANGNKPSLLQLFHTGSVLVSATDCKLRNGLGHNSASYDVSKDEVHYSNQNNSGIQNFQISYTRLCETVVNIYQMFEVATLYSDWLRTKVNVMR